MNEFQDCKVSIYKEAIENAGGDDPIFVAAIDQGTSSSRFLLFNRRGEIAASAQVEFTQIFPPEHVGWHEHDPFEIWDSVIACIKALSDACQQEGISLVIQALGITNQRETVIAWNATTGRVYYNAIVWDDLRTTDIASKISHGDKNTFRSSTGLPIASYFSGTKVRWLLDHVHDLRRDLCDDSTRDQVRFGTIDSWLAYQLTGTPHLEDDEETNPSRRANVGGRFVTDVTNASRWLFLNLHTVSWDPELISLICSPSGIDVPLSALPQILPSSCLIDHCSPSCGVPPLLQNVPISGLIGDQQAALFGQAAFEPGEAKNTYGTVRTQDSLQKYCLLHVSKLIILNVYNTPTFTLVGSTYIGFIFNDEYGNSSSIQCPWTLDNVGISGGRAVARLCTGRECLAFWIYHSMAAG